jgi:hypothetical protein
VYGGRLIGIEAEQPADALGCLALIAEGVPDDTYSQVGNVDALRELSHASQALDVTRVKLLQVGLTMVVLGMIGM